MVHYIESPLDRIVDVHFGGGATLFDGQACLYNLPTAPNDTDFLGSFWTRVSDIPARDFGHLWGSPIAQTGPIHAPDPATLTGEFDLFQNRLGISSATISIPAGSADLRATGWIKFWDTEVIAAAVNPWVHIMVAVKNKIILSVTADDTVIFANETQVLTPYPDDGLDTLPFGKYTNVPPSCWTICGTDRGDEDLPSPEFTGLEIALRALYLAPGQYLDITHQDIRDRFHTAAPTDSLPDRLVPASLGEDGSDPTGFPPLIYCDGGPSQFPNNRATGGILTVFGTLQSVAGP